MYLKERVYSMLIVSASATFNSALSSLSDEHIYSPVHTVSSISKAKLAINERAYDFVIINSPLPDEQGISYAIDLCSGSDVIVILLVSSEIHDEIYSKVAPYGVYTLPKPTSRTVLERALAWMISGRERIRRYEKKNLSISKKMEEIRLINHAKWLLISNWNMSEPDAHRYIEKQAMDRCISKKEIADEIINRFKKTDP